MMNANNYFGKVRQGVLGTANNEKQTPYIAVTVTLVHEAGNGEWLGITPVDRLAYWHLSEAAWPHTIKRLAAIGFTRDFNAIAFVGEAVETGVIWVCTHETYQGKTRERWDLANWGEKEHTPPTTDQIRTFNARLKTTTAAATVPSSPPPGPPQSTSASGGPVGAPLDSDGQPFDADDIPF